MSGPFLGRIERSGVIAVAGLESILVEGKLELDSITSENGSYCPLIPRQRIFLSVEMNSAYPI
jgi:hypothetical protein